MGLGGQEMLIIGLIILLLFGAKKLPEFARGLGKSMGEFKKARQEFEDEISRAAHDSGVNKAKQEAEQEIGRMANAVRDAAEKDVKV